MTLPSSSPARLEAARDEGSSSPSRVIAEAAGRDRRSTLRAEDRQTRGRRDSQARRGEKGGERRAALLLGCPPWQRPSDVLSDQLRFRRGLPGCGVALLTRHSFPPVTPSSPPLHHIVQLTISLCTRLTAAMRPSSPHPLQLRLRTAVAVEAPSNRSSAMPRPFSLRRPWLPHCEDQLAPTRPRAHHH